VGPIARWDFLVPPSASRLVSALGMCIYPYSFRMTLDACQCDAARPGFLARCARPCCQRINAETSAQLRPLGDATPASAGQTTAVSPQPTSAQPLPVKRRPDVGPAGARRVGRRCPKPPWTARARSVWGWRRRRLGVSSIVINCVARVGGERGHGRPPNAGFCATLGQPPEKAGRPLPGQSRRGRGGAARKQRGARCGLCVMSRGPAGADGTCARRCGWCGGSDCIRRGRNEAQRPSTSLHLEKT